MSNYASLKATINANIRENGNQEITGVVLNSVLNDIVDTMGVGYQYAGLATPSTNPGSPDARVFYLAATAGTYSHFGGLVLSDGEVAFLKWDSSWQKEVTGIASKSQLDDISLAIGSIETIDVRLATTWVQGSININTGENTQNTSTIRSGFITITRGAKIHVVCSSGYFIKAILAYNTASLNDYDTLVLFSYNTETSTFDTSVTDVVLNPDGKVLRICVGKTNMGTITAADGSNIFVYERRQGREEDIVTSLNRIDEEIVEINTIQVCANRISPNLSGKFLDTSGVEQNSTIYNTISKIPVVPGDVFRYVGYVGSAGVCAAGYNANGNFVSVLQTSGDFVDGINITIPSGIAFASFCGRIDTFPFGVRRFAGSCTIQEFSELVSPSVSGKRLYVIGDSITEGVVSNGVAPVEPWAVIVAKALNMRLTNYGISASSIAVAAGNGGMYASLADLQAATKVSGMYYTVLTGDQTFQVYYWNGSSLSTSTRKLRTPIVQRYAFMSNDADVVIVAGGTNDFQYNWTDVGTMADRTDGTFYGAMHLLCAGLLQKYLGKTIIFCTPIKRAQTSLDTSADTTAHRGGAYGSVDSQNLFGKTLGDYSNIIKEVCAYYSIPVIDMYSNSLLNPSLSSQTRLFDNVKTHPFQAGHNMMAKYIIGQIKAICG